MTRALGIRWKYALLLLPIVGLCWVAPLLWFLPIYPDELHANLSKARILIDGGKLVSLLPACGKGFLLDVPLSWYPSRLLDAWLFADMTNPRTLRYWSVATISALIIYAAWFARRLLRTETPLLPVTAAVVAPLSLGVLPFVLIFNRPEQGLLTPIFIGCTLPMLLPSRVRTSAAWALAVLYGLLAWVVTAAHVKGIFLLPALLFAALLTIRRWLPSLAVVVAAAIGVVDTLRIVGAQRECPESEFLTTKFRSVVLTAADLSQGPRRFAERAWSNLANGGDYWRHVSFRSEYQSEWLPTATSSPSVLEGVLNSVLPIMTALGFLVVVAAGVVEIAKAMRTRTWPRREMGLAALLALALPALAGFQTTKNFYEASLQAPVLGLAVILSLPSILDRIPAARAMGLGIMSIVAVAAAASQGVAVHRFAEHLPAWRQAITTRPAEQAALGRAAEECGIDTGARASRVMMDDFAYTVLWRTREPILVAYSFGWWGTGIDPAQLIRDRGVTALIGRCALLPPEFEMTAQTYGRYCCGQIHQPVASAGK